MIYYFTKAVWKIKRIAWWTVEGGAINDETVVSAEVVPCAPHPTPPAPRPPSGRWWGITIWKVFFNQQSTGSLFHTPAV